MKNLVHHLTKLQDNPTPHRMKMYWFINPNQELIARKDYGNSRWGMKKKLAEKILRGSVGRPVKDIFRKIKPLFTGQDETVQQFWDYMVDKFVGYTLRGETITTGRYGSWNVIGRGWRYRDLWEENGYLYDSAYAITYPYKTPKTRFDARKHYSFLTWRKKSWKKRKEEDKRLGLIALRLANKPNVFAFYRSLVKEKKELDEKEYKYKLYATEKASTPKHVWDKNKLWWKWSPSFSQKDILRRKQILHDIQQLEGGNYTMYFQSSTYMYSLQKECHHAIPTPHLKPPLS